MSDSMTERVAKALETVAAYEPCTYDGMARAAVAAMREPDDDYDDDLARAIEVLRDLLDRWADERGMDDVLKRARALVTEHALRHPSQAMIDAALNGEMKMKEQTLGDRRVRASFNPSKDDIVDRIKHVTAMLIDICEEMKSEQQGSEAFRLLALAQTAYEEAAMWAVKAATAGKP